MTAVAVKGQARDLEADAVICEKWDFGNPNATNQFVREAREGWLYAIRRALDAEAENDRLRSERDQLQEQLNQHHFSHCRD